MKLIVAGAVGSAAIGALGSAAVMALPAGAASGVPAGPIALTADSTGPVTATLTDSTEPASPPGGTVKQGSPTGALSPGGTGTVSAGLCVLEGCLIHETSQGSDGSTYVGNIGGWGAGLGIFGSASPEPPPPPGTHVGVAAGLGGDVTLGGVTVGASLEGKLDLAPYVTGVGSASTVSGSLTFPGISTLAQWLGYPNFAAANGIGFSVSQNNEGNPELSVFPKLSGGEDAEMRIGLFSGVSTPGFPSETGGSEPGGTGAGAATPAPGLLGGLTFDQLSYIPPPSAGFDGPAASSAPFQAAPPGTSWPSLTQMMTVPPAQGPVTWPDGTPATVPSDPVPPPTAPVSPDDPPVQTQRDASSASGQQVAGNSSDTQQQVADNTPAQQAPDVQQTVASNDWSGDPVSYDPSSDVTFDT